MIPLLILAAVPGEAAPSAPWTGLLFAFVLILLNGFFVAAEFALVKVRPTQLDPLAAEGGKSAEIARHMLRHLDAYLSATQLGITLASLALGWVGEPAFAWVVSPVVNWLTGGTNPVLVHSIAVWLSFLAITILHIVLGEQAPKTVAIRKPEGTSLFIALPLFAFYKVTYPAIWLLNKAAQGLLRMVGIQPVSESELAHDEEELRLLLSGPQAGDLSNQKRELLDNIFELSHRVARQIMVPRGDVIYLSTDRPLDENLRIARRSGHTRFPLCEGDLDHPIAIVHIKDIFRADRPISKIQDIARPIVFVPETLELDRLLKRMRGEKFHLAAVMDEYGGVSGIVTLENVIEEIVGEIQDEFDRETAELEGLAGSDGVYHVSGAMLVEDLEDELDLELSERDEDTIGGVVLSELGRVPQVGDSIVLGPLLLEVIAIDGHRVKTLRATVQSESAAEPPEH
ncbi:MAG TPA: hemolysin family protein [Thermoanaerobaculia bacterium]|nr:hemolysin family protein [Thermoanaerobaculia bacterium]